MNVLLIQYKMLGDVLTSTIIADQLKIAFPQACIHYLMTAPAAAIVENHPSIDVIIPVVPQDMERLGGIISLSRKLNKTTYDILIDAYGKNNSALLSYLVQSKQKIGYKKWFARLVYTHAVKNNPDPAIYTSGLAIGSRMLLTTPICNAVQWDLKPQIYLTPKEKEAGKTWLRNAGVRMDLPLTMVSVLGSDSSKTLPFSQMAQLLDTFVLKTKSQLLFNYIPAQKQDAVAIYKLCMPYTQSFIYIDAFASSIRGFLKITAQCKAVIGNEGGAINMAKALNIPTFTIFSPWINKSSWNIGEDNKKHVALHVKDFKPAIFEKKTPQQLKKDSLELYKQFTIDAMENSLNTFIEENYESPFTMP